MAIFTAYARRLARIAAGVTLAASQLAVTPAEAHAQTPDEPVQTAAADCFSVGEQVAAQYGGTLAKASASNSGGQTVCHIVVLVPGKDGQRPRRIQVDVPAG